MSAEQRPVAEMDFEEALEELEQSVDQLESGEVDLEEMLAHFERAMELRQHCARLLSEAETRIEQLVDEQGSTDPFSSGDSDADKT